MDRGALGDKTATEANGDSVRTRPRLQLGEQMADVRLDRFLRQEQALTDLPVHEPVGDELQHLHLASCRLLLERARRRLQREHGSTAVPAPARRDLVELARMRQITAQDLLALGSVHLPSIGARQLSL